MNLPGDESEEFLQRFREFRSESTTFVLAASDSRKELTVEPSLVNAVVNKPLEIEVLTEVVRECALVIPRSPLPAVGERDPSADGSRGLAHPELAAPRVRRSKLPA